MGSVLDSYLTNYYFIMSAMLGLTALSAILFDGLTDHNFRSHNHCFKNYHNKDVPALKFPREIKKKNLNFNHYSHTDNGVLVRRIMQV